MDARNPYQPQPVEEPRSAIDYALFVAWWVVVGLLLVLFWGCVAYTIWGAKS